MRAVTGAAALMSTASLLVPGRGALAAEAAASANVSEVVVTAPRQETAARLVQLQAPNLVSVQSAETILKYPDYNAAEALGRMPGISLSSDTGEGRFVQIRGIDANLDGATYGGVPLLNTNPGGTAASGGGRAVEFDTIPTGAVDGIIVTYTLLPDHEAEGLGGSIELSPRTATHVTRPFLDATLGWGYEPLHGHTGPFEADLAVGARFGFGDHGLAIERGDGSLGAPRAGFISNPAPFSFVITGSSQNDRRGVDDLEESYIDDFNPDGSRIAAANAIAQHEFRRYDYNRRRFSYGGEFDFQPNEDHTYYIRGGVAGYTESVHKNYLLFQNLGADENTSGIGPVIPPDPNSPNGYLVHTTPAVTLTDEEETHRNQIYAIGGVDRFGDTILDYHAAYSRATFRVGRNNGAEFDGPTADGMGGGVPITYDNVTRPDLPIFTFPTGVNVDDPSLYTLNPGQLSNAQEYDVDQEYSYAVNLSVPAHLINDTDRIKIGGEVRLRTKSASEYDESFNPPTPSLTGLAGPAILYYDNLYSNGPQINVQAIRSLINSPASQSSGPMFNFGSYVAAKENILADYVQYTTTIGKVGVLAGVRIEATDATYGGYVQATNADGSTTNTLLNRRVGYTNLFPTVQFKYSFTRTLVGRATWSTGIARPGFEQNTTAASVDRTANPLVITRGNPDLQPTTGNNFDLSLEYYLSNGGILSLALFDKEFNNYIVPRIQNGVVTDPLAPGELANVTTYLNVSDAYARGIQADFHQKFSFLPAPFDGLGVDANLTLVESHIQEYSAAQSLTGVAQYGLLPGTSQITWNLAGFYEAYGFEMRLAAEYVSHSLFGLGGDKILDTIQDSRLTVDLTSSYKINRRLTVYFQAKNLTNAPLRYYEGVPNRPIQREFYDITVEGGVRAHF